MNKKVFVVVVTYNGAHWIDKNIQSLLHSGYPVQVIAIDNHSTDNSVALLTKYPEVELMQSLDNLGFGKANNIGIKKALDHGADYVFLLNQDAWIFKDTVGNLVEQMEGHTSFGIISPQHFSEDGVIPDAGFANCLSRNSGKASDTLIQLPFVNAAAWMLSRRCIETVGYFEPLFGHYGEDRNYCDRVLFHKFKIGVDVTSKIIHDRTIKRNYAKDIIQSKYLVLNTLLNINHNERDSKTKALRQVVGLPKYFLKRHGVKRSVKLFFILIYYYASWLAHWKTIQIARNKAIHG